MRSQVGVVIYVIKIMQFVMTHECRIHAASSSSSSLCSEQVVLRRDGLVGDGRGEVEAGGTEALHRTEVVELEGRRRLRGGVRLHDCAKKEPSFTHSVSHQTFTNDYHSMVTITSHCWGLGLVKRL